MLVMRHRQRLVVMLTLLTVIYCATWLKIMTWTQRNYNQVLRQTGYKNTEQLNFTAKPDKQILVHTEILVNPLFSKDRINPHNFNFLITNADACAPSRNQTVFLVILVKSGINDIYDREQIRRTWGGQKVVQGQRVITMFLLGVTSNLNTPRTLSRENQQFRDIIQEDFVDSYRNLTFKNMMGLKWVTNFCRNVSYVASADADVMLNVHNLVTRLLEKPREQFAEGSLRTKSKPVRDADGQARKWYTSVDVYPEPTYPPFFPGSCYVMSVDVAVDIFRESSHVRFLPWDDVFVGLVMKRIGVKPLKGKGYERYPRSFENKTMKWTLKHGIAVIIHHQKQKVDERLIHIWHAVEQMQNREKLTGFHIVLIFLAIFGVLTVYLLVVAAFLTKCKQYEDDLEDSESDDEGL